MTRLQQTFTFEPAAPKPLKVSCAVAKKAITALQNGLSVIWASHEVILSADAPSGLEILNSNGSSVFAARKEIMGMEIKPATQH